MLNKPCIFSIRLSSSIPPGQTPFTDNLTSIFGYEDKA